MSGTGIRYSAIAFDKQVCLAGVRALHVAGICIIANHRSDLVVLGQQVQEINAQSISNGAQHPKAWVANGPLDLRLVGAVDPCRERETFL
jgi:hypothetical protein